MAMTLEDQNTVQSTPYDEEIIRLFVIATTFWRLARDLRRVVRP